jgi:hypothetical protein
MSSRAAGEGPAFSLRMQQAVGKDLHALLCFARCRARVAFLCLSKEKVSKRKRFRPTRVAHGRSATRAPVARKRVSSPPSVAPGAVRRVHGLRGAFRQGVRVLSKNARRPAARPAGLIRETCRNQGPRQVRVRVNTNTNTNTNGCVRAAPRTWIGRGFVEEARNSAWLMRPPACLSGPAPGSTARSTAASGTRSPAARR